MFVNFVWPAKLANIPPCYVFLIQIIEGNCIFNHSLATLANMVQDQNVDKHTPPQPWGANRVEVILHMTQALITKAQEDGVICVPAPIVSRVYQTLSRGFVNLLNAKKIASVHGAPASCKGLYEPAAPSAQSLYRQEKMRNGSAHPAWKPDTR
jgi:hypothetical protein